MNGGLPTMTSKDGRLVHATIQKNPWRKQRGQRAFRVNPSVVFLLPLPPWTRSRRQLSASIFAPETRPRYANVSLRLREKSRSRNLVPRRARSAPESPIGRATEPPPEKCSSHL